MINLVFLLLIFFLMTSQLAPPELFPVRPPSAASAVDPGAESTLYIDKSGQLAIQQDKGGTAFSILAASAEDLPVIRIRADGGLEAGTLALLLAKLAQARLNRVELVVTPK